MDANININQHVAPFCKPKEFAFFKPGDVAPSGADKRSPSVNRLQGAFQAWHLCRRQGPSSPPPSYQHRKRSKGRHTSKTPTTTSPTSSHLLNKPPEVQPYQ